ncbi:MAG: hypothetical protein ABJG68_15735 [Crocinitomicaceae bacterium]
MRLKSSSIYYALFMSLIISLFLGGMILFSSVNKQFSTQLEIQDRLIQNANSGVEYGLANYQEFEGEISKTIDLFGESIDSVDISKKQWGAYVVINSEAHFKGKTYAKVALAGQMNQLNEPNLFIVDQGRPITISGETRLEGKIAIPKSGLKRGYIEGKNYQGDKMIYGSQTESSKSLPKIQDGFKDDLLSFGGLITKWENSDSIVKSFSEEGVHYISDGYISIKNEYLAGQIVIEAKDSIFIGRNAQLSEVIVKSKVVHVQAGFIGTIQVFASEKITIEEDVTLMYPSVLGLLEETFPLKQQNRISIGENSQVIGSVFALTENPNFRLPVQIDIAKEAKVDGLVYCQGKTQLKGTVNGNLYTEKFYLETPSSKYENHLLDAKILNDLPEDFVYISLFENQNPLNQLKWLN